MEKFVLSKARDIWHKTGQYKSPGTLELEIDVYKKMLNLFQVGDYCYFIFCPPETRVEHINHSVETLIGYTPQVFTFEKFFDIIHPDDMPNYLNFEATIADFRRKTPLEQLFKYKSSYDFRIRCKDGQIKRLLQQVTVIQSDAEGAILRTFVVFTDITHLKQSNRMILSIIGLEGEPSYIDIQPVERLIPYKSILTHREKEVFRLMVNEYPSSAIAESLHISLNTVSSHRKNIFRKTGTKSVLQLIKFGLEKGWI